MLFNPKNIEYGEGYLRLGERVSCVAHKSVDSVLFSELWHGYTYRTSNIEFCECDTLTFTVGDAEPLPLGEYDYTVNVTEGGASVLAKSEAELCRGILTLLDRIVLVDNDGENLLKIDSCRIFDKPAIKNRMVHYCIFPDTALWELHKFVRLAGALKYTHIVLEFWGMYKYDCMKELFWSHAFTKEEILPIINEARAMGVEVVPMFNHWGHAAGCRACHGKHVVLDQNPSLQYYFDESGWCWDIKSKRVRELLGKVRRELCELCGEGSYFHIGCDEAYGFAFTKENVDYLVDYLNEIAEDMKSLGRRIFVWGDMFVAKAEGMEKYTCNAPDKEWETYIRKNLSHDIIIADWQYSVDDVPMKSAQGFKNDGFDVALCPWDRKKSVTLASVETVISENLFGIMHTTWHTLSRHTPYVSLTGRLSYDGVGSSSDFDTEYVNCAALLRKVWFANGDYEKAGWGRYEVGVDVT